MGNSGFRRARRASLLCGRKVSSAADAACMHEPVLFQVPHTGRDNIDAVVPGRQDGPGFPGYTLFKEHTSLSHLPCLRAIRVRGRRGVQLRRESGFRLPGPAEVFLLVRPVKGIRVPASTAASGAPEADSPLVFLKSLRAAPVKSVQTSQP